VLAALGLGAKELFSYNRENFKFDQDQRLERESLRLEMQVKRFELFREDVRDLVELTVDRMDVYHLVGALFLEFCIVLFCEGRVQASAPPFLLSLFLLSNACAFIYLLLAVWLSMHASIAAHSFGVRLLTRFVRLPIPSLRQMDALRSQLKDYEKQGVANLLRLPFQDKQEWTQRGDDDDRSFPHSAAGSASGLGQSSASASMPRVASSYLKTAGGDSSSSASMPVIGGRPESFGPSADVIGRAGQDGGLGFAGAPAGPRRQEQNLLAEEAEHPLGGEDLLKGLRGAQPERHVQLFRQLQAKWQCYDAYCRVCMGLGVNQILQGLSYYCICHTLVENRSPTTGYALVAIFQCTTVALAVLDLAGLNRREIVVIQVIGIMPCALTAWGIAHGRRDERGVMDPEQDYMMSPFSFLLQVLWLELWLRVAAPSGDDTAKLPRRFRQILFLDVFGDAAGWDPTQAENENQGSSEMMDRSLVDDIMNDDEADREAEDEMEALTSVAEQAASQLAMGQCAIRRWGACSDFCLSPDQTREFDALREKLKTWGNAVHAELVRYRHHGGADSVFEPELRRWHDLAPEERWADPFAKCLVGPFESNEGYTTTIFHFDVETSHTLYGDAVTKERPGALVLTLQAVSTIIEDLEKEARRLLEARIMRDLHSATRQQQLQARERQKGAAQTRQRALQQQHLAQQQQTAQSIPARSRMMETAIAAKESFPNLLSIFFPRKPATASTSSSSSSRTWRDRDREQNTELLSGPGAPDALTHSASAPASLGGASSSSSALPSARDPTLVAMAGKHARHFVPERLPWQVLSRMTRVLQGCWLFSGVMALLKELHMYQVDFQQHPGHERRLQCAAGSGMGLEFEELAAEWPQGSFFRPQGLWCPSSTPGEVWVGSPSAVYSGSAAGGQVRLTQIASAQLPPSASVLCPPSEVGGMSSDACLLASVGDGGLWIWPMGHHRGGPLAVNLLLESAPWQSVAGGVVHCNATARLLPGDDVGGATEWCLVLAGWDGELLPVAVVPLPGGPGSPPRAGSVVRPGLDVPLAPGRAYLGGTRALHFEPRSGRLWALLPGGEIEAWELLSTRPLGHWPSPRWPAASSAASVVALCAHAAGGELFALARGGASGPRLLRARLPPGLDDGFGTEVVDSDRGATAVSFRGLASNATAPTEG